MHTRRIRIVSASLVAFGMLALWSVGSDAAVGTCALSAPSTVRVGRPVAITGSGFPASTSIDISIGLEGATPDEFSVQSDGAGAFQIDLTPELADAGKTTVLAMVGTTCTAQAVFTVTGATATPAPTAEATSSPRASGAGATSNPPRTDAGAAVDRSADKSSTGWGLALLIILIGVGGLLTTRTTAGR